MVGPALPAAGVRAFVADAHDVSRHGLADILLSAGAEVVAALADADELMTLLRAQPLSEEVDVLLVGLDLSASRDPGVIQAARSEWPDMAVVALSDVHSDLDVLTAMATGASAYVPKTANRDDLLTALLSAVAAPRAFTASGLAAASRRRAREEVSPLTSRETEVLRLAADGLAVKDISAQLFISQATTRSHLAVIYRKLDVGSRSSAVLVAERRGLLR